MRTDPTVNQEEIAMADEATPFKPKKPKLPDDAADLNDLWDDPVLGDGITDETYSSVPFGKPKGMTRTGLSSVT